MILTALCNAPFMTRVIERFRLIRQKYSLISIKYNSQSLPLLRYKDKDHPVDSRVKPFKV
jgi:hypothetical protein